VSVRHNPIITKMADDKRPLKGLWSGHVTHFKCWSPNDSSGTAETRVVKFCIQVDYRMML